MGQTQKGHLARATLEATCFQTKAILDAMEKDSGQKLSELAVDGGMSNSDLCMQVRWPESSFSRRNCCQRLNAEHDTNGGSADPSKHYRNTC